MNEILFYLISTSLFLVIIKEAMGIFFVKKDEASSECVSR